MEQHLKESKLPKERRLLILLDLDGTVLSDSSTSAIHEETCNMITKAIARGHIVCILTGRPWRSSKVTYERLNLKTIIANYNGVQIHNPSDEYFTPLIHSLHLNEILYILGDKFLEKQITNIAIEGPGWVQLSKRDHNLERVFGFKNAPKFMLGLDLNRLPMSPTGVIFDITETCKPDELQRYLRRKYGDIAEFSYWSKGEGLTPVFDIAPSGINKGKVVPLLMRYYNIPWERTVSIGDSFNDIPMFKNTNISVAMSNATMNVKKRATVKIDVGNKTGGVGYYLKKLLNDPEKEIAKSLKIHRENEQKELNNEI